MAGKSEKTQNQDEILKLLEEVTPMPVVDNGLDDEQKIAKLTRLYTEVLQTLGLDLKDDSLMDSPRRIAKMYVNEIFSGLNPKNFPKITTIDNKMSYKQMIVVKRVRILSLCEHHFVTIDGEATIAYIPAKKVIGLSKINRIADFFARRPQVQERLTKQIADCLENVLGTPHVAVHINAKHYCVISRGVRDENSTTSTNDLRGDFLNRAETRNEFLSQVSEG